MIFVTSPGCGAVADSRSQDRDHDTIANPLVRPSKSRCSATCRCEGRRCTCGIQLDNTMIDQARIERLTCGADVRRHFELACAIAEQIQLLDSERWASRDRSNPLGSA